MLNALQKSLGNPNIEKTGQWLFQSAFWLFAAKVLKDKEVKNFHNLDLSDPASALLEVHNHYHSERRLKYSKRQQNALQEAAFILSDFGNLSCLTIESLAYVYENTLIDKNIRKALGIHATPSYLVDYIVWQMAGWIEKIPPEKRVVLEPSCGHAPFLIAAARLLREMVYFDDSKKLHDYLKTHLIGIDKDDFAREIARLSLTLADVPNPNDWNLQAANIFQGEFLQNQAKRSTILLCNPPFEDFTPQEQSEYKRNTNELHCFNKAAEVLCRTLPHMPAGSVFGVILPQGFLHSTKQAIPDLRKLMIKGYELAEICTLPENVFAVGKHKSVVILGRKIESKPKYFTYDNKVQYRHIHKWDLPNFIDRYQANTENIVQSRYLSEPDYNLRWPMLREVWDFCRHLQTLSKVADVGQGLVYKGKDLPSHCRTISKTHFRGAVEGYTEYDKNIKITDTPHCNWLNLNKDVIRRPQWGIDSGIPQLILNYIRVSPGPWRLKGMIDRGGRPVTSNFIVIRPKNTSWNLNILWTLLNTPLANAYTYCHSLERNNQVGTIRSIPIPEYDSNSFNSLNQLVKEYFDLYSSNNDFFQPGINPEEARRRMLAIDAEVLRLYNLPPRLERQVLDLFAGWERKGVDFDFTGYFPEAFDAWVPLHEYLSDKFQNSTPANVKKWVEEVRTPELISALHHATEDFEGD